MRYISLFILVSLFSSFSATAQYTISKCDMGIKPKDIPPPVPYCQGFIGEEQQYKNMVANYLATHNIKKSKQPYCVIVFVYIDSLGKAKTYEVFGLDGTNKVYNKTALAIIRSVKKWSPQVKTFDEESGQWYWVPRRYIERVDF